MSLAPLRTDEKGCLGIRVRGGGLHRTLGGSLDAIGEGRTHPTSIYISGQLIEDGGRSSCFTLEV